jgi:hypothetical protein
LPGRTAAEAREAVLVPLRKALSCITDAQFIRSPEGANGADIEALTISQEPLHLSSGPLGNIQLALRQRFRAVQESRSEWHVSTVAYYYRIADSEGRELAAWHWHPASVAFPHLHCNNSVIGRRAHLPTGRVSIESVLRLLIDDLGVPTRRDDYADVLDEAERKFIDYRRWHA